MTDLQILEQQVSEMRLALTILIERIERLERDCECRNRDLYQAAVTRTPAPVFYDEAGALGGDNA